MNRVSQKSVTANNISDLSGRAIVQDIEHNIGKEVVNPPRSHSWHSLFPSFASTKRPTRRFSVLLQLRSHPHPCGFEVVLYGCSLGARDAVGGILIKGEKWSSGQMRCGPG